ncbi:MAG: shikimate dehydrogenase [Gammaproteobacteria bacterium]|nr:shikimate dehydrogenase [Gammaproteobacteria bacterium]
MNIPIDRYAVMGNPIGHSKSPKIHALFAQQTGQRLSYEALLVELGGFAAAVDQFQRSGGKGLNITVPFKQEAWALIANRSPRAGRAGAVNTIVFADDGSCYADTTDGVGLVRDLTINHGITLQQKRVLILGAGGAVRGVLEPILEQKPAALVIANRTAAKAVALAQLFRDQGNIFGCGFEALVGRQFDVVINGTAASLEGKVPPLPENVLAKDACCYDMMYSNQPTAFQVWAQQQGARQALDGLGMLVEQAAESFFLWRGVRPQTASVIAEVRRQMLKL